MIGQTLGTYRLIEKLGEGGMGEVYRALDEMLDRDVALKMLKPELARRQATVDRFRAEAITLAKLDHPGIARIHGCSRHDDRWFIVMEFVRGETLLARLHRAGRLPWTEAVPIVCQLLDALEYAHRRGVIHRDMKPANVLMSTEGTVKVTDFGIARVLGTERATRTGHIVGTLEYMSPEQVRGEEVDGRADLYAVGILLHELLAGRVPFRGAAEYDVMRQHLTAPVPSLRGLPDVPAWFDDILQRALAKGLADRFPSAAAFQVAIEGRAAAEPAMRVKATRLANAAMDAAVVGGIRPLPRATDPQAVAPTLPGPMTAPTMVGTHSRPVMAARSAAPEPAPTRLASGGDAAPPAPPQLPSPTRIAGRGDVAAMRPASAAGGAAAATPGLALGARTVTWRQLTAAGAVVVVLLASAIVVARRLSGDRVAIADANAPSADAARPVLRPEPPILDSPPPPPIDTAPPIALDPSPTPRGPGAGTPAPGRPAAPVTTPPITRPPVTAPPATDGGPGAETPAPSPAPTETAPAPAPRAEAGGAAIEFEEVGLMTVSGSDMEEREVLLRFEPDRLVLFDEDAEAAVRTVPYRSLSEATYARSRHPVAKAERDRPTLVRGLAKAGSLFRRTPHWLTLEGTGTPIVLKIDGGDVERVLSTLEARTPVKVARVSEK
jgi:eukaryotic-like serine/threonine-protein kinase